MATQTTDTGGGVNFDAIPNELKQLEQWVLWEYRRNTKGPKPKKWPLQTDGTSAATDDRSTWADFESVIQAREDGIGIGIGFVFAEDDPYVAIDLDKCRNPESGELEEWALATVQQLDSYTEISPSGAGVHILVRADVPGLKGRNGDQVEMYAWGRYFTMTGIQQPGSPDGILERTEAAIAIHAAHFKPTQPLGLNNNGKGNPGTGEVAKSSGLSDDDVIANARARFPGSFDDLFVRGDISAYGGDDSVADQALCWRLSRITVDRDQIDRLMCKSALLDSAERKEKWDSLHGDSTYGHMTIEKAISWVPDDAANRSQKSKMLQVISLDSVEPIKVSWLMKGWIPRGKLSLLAGYPGDGKTFIALDIAGAVANGSALPTGEVPEPRRVLYMSGEDGLEDTIVPRLDALGHSRENIDAFTLTNLTDESFELDRDHKRLAARIEASNYGLVVIDPINAFVPNINVNNATEVRQFLTPLAAMAERHDLTILGLLHFNKSTEVGNKIDLVSGSRDIAAAARAIHYLVIDEDDDRRFLVPVKMNLGPMPVPLEYGLKEDRIVWLGEAPHAAKILRGRKGRQPKRSDAKQFLKILLRDGPIDSDIVARAAEAAGHTTKTLQRARGELDVQIKYRGIKGKKGGRQTAWSLD